MHASAVAQHEAAAVGTTIDGQDPSLRWLANSGVGSLFKASRAREVASIDT
jgi:hypothetical protein